MRNRRERGGRESSGGGKIGGGIARAAGGVGRAALVALIYAPLAVWAPIAPASVAAAVAFVAALYFVAEAGAPRAAVLAPLWGLGLAAGALWLHWVVWAGVVAGDASAALVFATLTPEAQLARLIETADRQGFAVGGRTLAGESLRMLWALEAAAALLAGSVGGQLGRRRRLKD